VARSHPRHGNGHSGNGAIATSTDDEEDDDDAGPRIVKTKRFAAKPMDPEEAALQMDLLGHAFFLFTNTETGHAALLYRRNDGNLGLIESVA
jgi:putative sigma-54 modulation protein